jgi:leucyl aminopeptidase
MNFELLSLDLAEIAQTACDALVVVVPSQINPPADEISVLIQNALDAGDLDTKPGKTLSLYRPQHARADRLILAGAGSASADHVRAAVMAAIASIKGGSKIKKVTVALGLLADTRGAAAVALMAIADASYVYTTTKSKSEPRSITHVTLAVGTTHGLGAEFAQAQACMAGVEFAKEWANRPANYSTPSQLAQAAEDLGKSSRISCKVLGPKEIAKLGMGAFMAVAQGSDEALRFIVLEYAGSAKAKSIPPNVLVGKGITFDTGGISLKPASEMDEMKFDMSGAASVLGVFKALSVLKPDLHVVGLIPACENMPGSRALKPGDVITSMSGQTIEVLNTDAEGRLILCDALTYAERYKPRAVVDVATLTGACVIALGHLRSGLFSNSDDLAQQILSAGEASQDPCWRLPLDEEYAEALKSNFADVANVGGRAGGSVTAAKFLHRFARKYAWAHLDIAGTAWKSGANKGATGRPVPLLLEFLLQNSSPVAFKVAPDQDDSKPVSSKAKGSKAKAAKAKSRRT